MENARRGSRPRKFNTAEKAGERKFEKRRDDVPVKGRRKSESGDSEEKRSFRSDRPSYKRTNSRFDDPREERSSRSGYRNSGSSSYGERKPFRSGDADRRRFDDKEERSGEDRGERRGSFRGPKSSNYGERKPFRSGDTDRRRFDDKEERSGEDRGERRGGFRGSKSSNYGERKPFRSDDSDRRRSDRPRDERGRFQSSDRSDRKSYGRTDSRDSERPTRGGFFGRRKESTGYEKRRNDPREKRFNDGARDERRDFERTKHYEREDRFERKERGSRSERFENRNDSGEIRLNRYIAQSGICSRREADEMIALGEVKVNGKVVTEMGTKVTKNDTVIVNEELIKNEKLVYLVLNKPKGFITSLDDPEGRDTVMELVKHACKERIYPVGRLDRNTTGILLFTNDGDLAKKLTHPSHQIRKIYHVTLDKALTHNDMQQLTDGVLLEDGLAKADVIAYVGAGDDKKDVGVELHSGKNRIVRRLFEHLDYKVVKLDRVSFAGITKKDLPRGRWRFLEDREISFLKMV